MLRKTVFVYLLLGILLSFVPWVVSAEDKSPHDIIEKTSAEVLAALKNDSREIKNNPNKINELVDEIILPICDFRKNG